MTIKREMLYQAIDKLPEKTLVELAEFIEFLQFKTRQDESLSEPGELLQENKSGWQPDPAVSPPFTPVHFPEGILQGFDFSPEYIANARQEMWAGLGKGIE